MTNDDMSDEVYQPQSGEIQEDAGPLEPEDTLDDSGLDDVLDEGYSPPERPRGVTETGTTVEEQQAGESLDERLSRERPDDALVPDGDALGDVSGTDGELLDPEAGDRRAGRLAERENGTRQEQGAMATDVGIDGGAASAEEAAVHIVEDPDLRPDDDR